MYRIGEFSTLSKTTIKTLGYYEKEGLLLPAYVDQVTGYRFYETRQLIELSRIIALRQIGIPIKDIKQLVNGDDMNTLLKKRKEILEKDLMLYNQQLSKINYLLEEQFMDYEVITKELPEYTVYYKEGIIQDYSALTNFILSSAKECKTTNPNIKCIEPDYCFVSYLDGEYRESNIKVKYAQAVTEEGIPNDTIQFEKLKPVNAVCIYHQGSYDHLPDAYSFIMNYIEKNGYEIIELPRERYIDGIWNKEKEADWLTEIQVPISKKNESE